MPNFLVTRDDGRMEVIIPVSKEAAERINGAMTDEDYENWIRARSEKPHHSNWERMTDEWEPPKDRTYRNAWRQRGAPATVPVAMRGGVGSQRDDTAPKERVPNPERPEVEVDMPHAREIHRFNLRRRSQRGLRMEALDVEYMRADERNDQQRKQEVAAQKQKLRDVTSDPRIEAAQTVEELKALTLDVLTGTGDENGLERNQQGAGR